jgi:hypothetical protein
MADPLELIISDSTEDQLMGCLASVFDAIMKNPQIGSDGVSVAVSPTA